MDTLILMIGAHPYRVKGGVSGWARNILSSDLSREFPIRYIATMVDGPWLMKLGVAFRALIIFIADLCFSKVSLVHVHGSKGASFYRKMIFILFARIWKKRIIFHCHSGKFDQFYYGGRSWQKALIGKVLAMADRIIILSPQWIPFFSQFLPSSRLIVLENAVPLERYQREGTKYSKASRPTILFAGLLTDNKGIFDLLAIIPDLISRVPLVKILLAGTGNELRIRNVLKEKGIEEAVEILGWVEPEQLIGLYHQAHLFVLPTYYEGMPMVVLEAMACGLPVVGTRVGGMPELIEEGENGKLIKPGDRPALLEALSTLLSHPTLREIMGQTNIKKIKAKYDLPIYQEQLKGIYRELLGEQR